MLRFKIIVVLLPLVILFGQEADRILFQHNLHIDDMELNCSDCHAGVTSEDGKIFPEERFCLECHDGDTADNSCEYCHSNPDTPLPLELLPT